MAAPEAVTRLNEVELFNHPGASTSIVWNYFGFEKTKEGPPNKQNLNMNAAVCRICRKSYANKGNTTNMMAHLRAAHNQMVIDAKSVKPFKLTQPKIDQSLKTFMLVLPADRVKQLDDSLLKLLVGKVLPLSMVDSPFFRDFLQNLDPRYRMPPRKTVTSMLQKKKEEMTGTLLKELSKMRDVAITHDGWTSIATESYQTVTAHFITAEWELKSAVLETRKLTGSHTGEAIAAALTTTKETWSLPVPTATTDNAANEIKAFDILQWERFGCYGHRINLAVKKALNVAEISTLLAKGRKLVTFFHQSSSAADLLRDNQQTQFQKTHKLIQACPTRWNSSLYMLECLLKQTPAIMAIVHNPKCGKTIAQTMKLFSFNFQEQALLEKVIEVIKPFEKATSILCAETEPTLPKVIPTLLKLKTYTTVQEDDCKVIEKLKKELSEQMKERTKDTDLILLASLLNPCMKDMQCLSIDDQNRVKQLLKDEMESLSIKEPVVVKKETEEVVEVENGTNLPPLPPLLENLNTTNTEKDELEAVVPQKKIKLQLTDMEAWFDDIVFTGQSVVPKEALVEQELSNYFAASVEGASAASTMLKWWKTNHVFFPRISILAKKILAIPASSVPSERVFSLAGGLVNKKRARLSAEHIDTIIFLNKNMKNYW